MRAKPSEADLQRVSQNATAPDLTRPQFYWIKLLWNPFHRKRAVFRILLSDPSHLLVRGIVVPGVNGINVRVPIDDDALWWLAIDSYDLISAPGGAPCREQLTTVGLNEFSRLRQILLRIPLGVRDFNLPNEIDRRLRLCMESFYRSRTYSHAGEHRGGNPNSRAAQILSS